MTRLKLFKQPLDKHKRILMHVLHDLYNSCEDIKHDPLFGYVSNTALLEHVLEKIALYYNMIGELKYE